MPSSPSVGSNTGTSHMRHTSSLTASYVTLTSGFVTFNIACQWRGKLFFSHFWLGWKYLILVGKKWSGPRWSSTTPPSTTFPEAQKIKNYFWRSLLEIRFQATGILFFYLSPMTNIKTPKTAQNFKALNNIEKNIWEKYFYFQRYIKLANLLLILPGFCWVLLRPSTFYLALQPLGGELSLSSRL